MKLNGSLYIFNEVLKKYFFNIYIPMSNLFFKFEWSCCYE